VTESVDPRPSTVVRALAVVAVFAAVVVASNAHGLPHTLPGAALGWPLLFHFERAAVLLATLGVVLLVGWRAINGEFPVKFGQLEYAVKDAAASAADVDEAHELRLQTLEVLAGLRDAVEDERRT
jgi:hypothetical protein